MNHWRKQHTSISRIICCSRLGTLLFAVHGLRLGPLAPRGAVRARHDGLPHRLAPLLPYRWCAIVWVSACILVINYSLEACPELWPIPRRRSFPVSRFEFEQIDLVFTSPLANLPSHRSRNAHVISVHVQSWTHRSIWVFRSILQIFI